MNKSNAKSVGDHSKYYVTYLPVVLQDFALRHQSVFLKQRSENITIDDVTIWEISYENLHHDECVREFSLK